MSYIGGEHRLWLCKCDCGNEKNIDGYSLRRGHTKSCGCYHLEVIRKEFGYSSKWKVYSKYRRSAKGRNLPFELTFEQFLDLSQRNCYYCGIKPSNFYIGPRNNGGFTYQGIDRIDSTKGYTLGNVFPCCSICNHAKNNMTYDEFMEWIERVVNKNK